MKRILQYLALVTALSYGCKPKPAQETVMVENEAAKAMFAKLPPPLEVAARIQATGADFNPAFLSNPENAATYAADTNRRKMAANLGFYLSDMGYCIAYKQKEDVQKYYNATTLLANQLGIEKDLLNYIMKRYEQNLDNNDSLKSVLGDLYNSSTNEITGQEALTIKGIVSSAMYLESLHSLLAIIETYPKDMLPDAAKNVILAPVFRLVMSQKENVNNIQMYLNEVVKTAPRIEFYNRSFNELSQVYAKLDIQSKIDNNQFEDLMNDQVVQDLIFRVGNIRDEVLKTPGM